MADRNRRARWRARLTRHAPRLRARTTSARPRLARGRARRRRSRRRRPRPRHRPDLVDPAPTAPRLHDDLLAIARATASPPARRSGPRDFQLSPEQAARLRPRGWRRFVAAFAAPGSPSRAARRRPGDARHRRAADRRSAVDPAWRSRRSRRVGSRSVDAGGRSRERSPAPRSSAGTDSVGAAASAAAAGAAAPGSGRRVGGSGASAEPRPRHAGVRAEPGRRRHRRLDGDGRAHGAARRGRQRRAARTAAPDRSSSRRRHRLGPAEATAPSGLVIASSILLAAGVARAAPAVDRRRAAAG